MKTLILFLLISSALIAAPTTPINNAVIQNAGTPITGVVQQNGATAANSAGLTSGRVPFATTGGLLTDAATLTFSAGTLNAGTNFSAPQLTSTIATGTAPLMITSTTLVPNLNVATAGTATNATNIGITDDNATNATMYPLWVTANTGNLPAKVSSTQLSFNPSTSFFTLANGGGIISTGSLTLNAFGVGGAGDKNVYLNTNVSGWGHVGIGQYANTIALPGAPAFFAKQLHIADYGASGVFTDTVAGPTTYTGRFTGGLPGSPTAVTNGLIILRLDSLGYDGSVYSTDPASVRFQASQNWTSTAHGTQVSITSIANNTTASFQAMVIMPDGAPLFTPQKPASVATSSGTNSSAFTFTGAAGGDTTIATTGAGGVGSPLTLNGGPGGNAASAVTAGTGGAGGAVTIASGAGGASAVAGAGTGTGGNSGNLVQSTGNGGAASTSTGVNVGGNAGFLNLTTGNGGAATNGSTNTGGTGGSLNLTTGNGGAGATAAGNSGTMTLNTGTAGAGGTVGSIVLKTGGTTAVTINASQIVNISGTTSASSATTGTVTIGNGTAATNVGIGAGNINAGGTITAATYAGLPNNIITTIAAGTAYTLTASNADVTFGTTSPTVTLPAAGTYELYATIQTNLVAATYATPFQTVTYNLHRQNNTAADLSGSTFGTTINMVAITTQTFLGPVITIDMGKYVTVNTNDIIGIRGVLSATPSVGSVTCSNATITGVRIF